MDSQVLNCKSRDHVSIRLSGPSRNIPILPLVVSCTSSLHRADSCTIKLNHAQEFVACFSILGQRYFLLNQYNSCREFKRRENGLYPRICRQSIYPLRSWSPSPYTSQRGGAGGYRRKYKSLHIKLGGSYVL